MAKNIADLREHLFDTIAALKSGAIDVDKAKVIADVSQVIINSAKVEVDFIRASNSDGTGFISIPEAKANTIPRLVKGSAMSGSR